MLFNDLFAFLVIVIVSGFFKFLGFSLVIFFFCSISFCVWCACLADTNKVKVTICK